MSIEEKVKEIIVQQLGVDAEKVSPEASFVDDLGADSLDVVELVMAFEEEFEVESPDEAARRPHGKALLPDAAGLVRSPSSMPRAFRRESPRRSKDLTHRSGLKPRKSRSSTPSSTMPLPRATWPWSNPASRSTIVTPTGSVL